MRSIFSTLIILLASVSLACNLPAASIEPAPTQASAATTLPATLEAAADNATLSTITPAQTSAPAPAATATATPTPNVPTALFIMNANCRSGPNKSKEAVMSFLEGETAEILGRNNDFDNTWWLVKIPGSKGKCWVSTITVNVIGSYDDIPTIPPPY